jgi:hypothetical protein
MTDLSPWGYLVFLLWTLLLVGLLPDQRVALLLGSVLLFALLTGGGGLRSLRRRRFWTLILSALALGPLVLGEKDLVWGWLHFSRDGFWTGLWMALRALCLTVAFSVALNALSVSEMARLFETVGLKGLGFALGVHFAPAGWGPPPSLASAEAVSDHRHRQRFATQRRCGQRCRRPRL